MSKSCIMAGQFISVAIIIALSGCSGPLPPTPTPDRHATNTAAAANRERVQATHVVEETIRAPTNEARRTSRAEGASTSAASRTFVVKSPSYSSGLQLFWHDTSNPSDTVMRVRTTAPDGTRCFKETTSEEPPIGGMLWVSCEGLGSGWVYENELP